MWINSSSKINIRVQKIDKILPQHPLSRFFQIFEKSFPKYSSLGAPMGLCYGRDKDEQAEESKPVLSMDEKNALSSATKERRAGQRLIENMVHEEFNRDIDSVYFTKKTEVLGTGLCGIVRVCIHKQTKIQYALKTLDKKKVKDSNSLNNLKNEIRIMALLGHPNIVRLHEYFESPDKIYLVMELCGGGELLEHLHRQHLQKYPEKTACKLVRSVLGAIRYCHEHSIVHRDLKLENFLFENKSQDAELKLIDFGLSQHFNPEELMNTPVGTPYYVAPEVLSGAYDAKCDVWSIGVIAYMLLSGSPPFHGNNDAETLKAVQEGTLVFNKYFNPVSAQAKDFIRTCLTRNVSERPTAEALQKHEWFKILHEPAEPMSTDIIHRLQGFEKKSALSRLCTEVVAHTLTAQQIKGLRKEFLKLDVNQSGEISYEDLKSILQLNGRIPTEEIDKLFSNGRTGWEHTGKINYHEFIAATISISAIKDENLKLAFEMMSNRNGYITAEDIQDLLGKDATQQEVERMLSEMNLNLTSHITYADFERIMRDGGGSGTPKRPTATSASATLVRPPSTASPANTHTNTDNNTNHHNVHVNDSDSDTSDLHGVVPVQRQTSVSWPKPPTGPFV
eukprot:gene6695-13575_t